VDTNGYRVVRARSALFLRDIHHDVAPPIYVVLMAQTQLAQSLAWRVFCTYCDDDLDHCHGVAIVSDGTSVCSEDPDCRVAIELHQFVSFDE
jgi:hypothetical protein